jgi:hypothetical protein
MLQKIVALVLPGTAPFEFGVICEVFGIDRSESGGPTFEYHIATADPGPTPTSSLCRRTPTPHTAGGSTSATSR